MSSLSVQRILLTVVPAALILIPAGLAIWSDSGTVERARLERQLEASQSELAAIERQNARLLRELKLAEEEDAVLERWVAEEIGWTRPGTTLVRFDNEE
ncbi:MAG: hypothetical protein KTR31_39495 [Myxococcales bacterium]|nr:hypothetical protein [Myxococcales bacterium]